MKKIIVLLAAAFAAMSTFTSCDDVTDCGCECSQPVVSKVELLDSAGVDYSNKSIPAGSAIVVMGENLGDVVAVKFGNKTADLKPAYRTENTLVFVVPTVTKSCQGMLVTSSCPNGYVQSKLSIVVGAPTAYMFYNEFVASGDYLKVKGSSFVGDSLEVDFVGTDGKTKAVSGSDLIKKDEDGTELWVKVPADVAESHPVTFVNKAEGKSSVSKIYFRDTRNMLVDFDKNIKYTYSIGDSSAAGENYSVADYTYNGQKLTSLISNNYSTSAVNNYAIFGKTDDWKAIIYAPNSGEEDLLPNSNVFGTFLTDGVTRRAEDYVLKFEVYVPSAYPLQGVTLTIGFTRADESTMNNFRKYCAIVNFSKVLSWGKNTTPWSVATVENMSTDGWMTVTVPMSEFKWNLKDGGYAHCAQNILTGSVMSTDDLAKLYGDATTMNDYVNEYPTLTDTKKYGGLTIAYATDDQAYKNQGKFFMAVDNVRIVPDDGNGAIYPRLKYGEATQHYISAPRTKAFGE